MSKRPAAPRRHRPFAVLVMVALSLSGCLCLLPWQRYRMPRGPDWSCFEPGTHGWALYIWNCVNGEHVVIGQYSSEMWIKAPTRETASCGQTTPLERTEVEGGPCQLRPGGDWGR